MHAKCYTKTPLLNSVQTVMKSCKFKTCMRNTSAVTILISRHIPVIESLGCLLCHLASLDEPGPSSVLTQNTHNLGCFCGLASTHFIREGVRTSCKDTAPDTSSKQDFCAGFTLLSPLLPTSESLRDADQNSQNTQIDHL